MPAFIELMVSERIVTINLNQIAWIEHSKSVGKADEKSILHLSDGQAFSIESERIGPYIDANMAS